LGLFNSERRGPCDGLPRDTEVVHVAPDLFANGNIVD